MWNQLDRVASKCDIFTRIAAAVSLLVGIVVFIHGQAEKRSIHVIYDTDYRFSKRDDIRKDLDRMFDGYVSNSLSFMREMAAAEGIPTNKVEELATEASKHFGKFEKVYRHYWHGLMDFVFDNQYEKKSIHVRNVASKTIEELRVNVSGYTNLRDVELSSANPRSDRDWFRKEMVEDRNKRMVLIPYRNIPVGDVVTFTVVADTVASADVVVQALCAGNQMNVEEMTYTAYMDRRRDARTTMWIAFGGCGIFVFVWVLLRIHRRLRAIEANNGTDPIQ